jgi:hypothetical protein
MLHRQHLKYLNKWIELELYNPTSIQVKYIHKTIKEIRKKIGFNTVMTLALALRDPSKKLEIEKY